jgi:16S rRNA processing protein RimM
VVALVRGARGLDGTVRVEVLTDRPEERFARGAVLHREGRDDSLTIERAMPAAKGLGWWLRLREVRDRAGADALRGTYLEASVEDGELARGEYYWHEVVGASVQDLEGRSLGTVRDVYRSGGAEVFVVAGGPFGEFDLPAVRPFIRIFAPRRGEIVVDAEALDLHPPADLRPPSGTAPRIARTRRRRGVPEPAAAEPPDESEPAAVEPAVEE